MENFKTSAVTDMGGVFFECNSLTSVDLSSFDTSKVQSIYAMFYQCHHLSEVDLSNFETPALYNIEWVFGYNYDIKYIDLKKYGERYDMQNSNTLYAVRENIVVCIDESANNVAKLKERILEKKCYNIYCGDDWRDHIRKYDHVNHICPENCLGYNYETDDNYCYDVCLEGEIATLQVLSQIQLLSKLKVVEINTY